ncbi:alpha/beta hydrolase [Sulfitobacter sp. F26169L]|uniref:alpha/beta fold hydrolase n=1 Tax=Sulfitobacter sp. F26169L TaxID=2996015 RepID=UPI002260D9B2|nr:alpha/beta hydrolase [Sulfitobacter sp. F26169L]MCX7567983.1 alpha/beta hydrolase [Sulfitobacter sp. F26169L]
MTDEKTTVQVGDHLIAYRHNGQNSASGASAIVLIHGAGCTSQDWPQSWLDKQTGDLEGHAVYALDLPGHGASDGPPVGEVAAMGALVNAFAARIGLTDVCLVGHSMGAAIALSCALQDAPHLRQLVLIAGADRFGVQQGLLDGLEQDFSKTAEKVAQASWKGAVDTSRMAATVEAMQAAGKEILVNDFTACRNANLGGVVSGIEVPVLAIAARPDRMVQLEIVADLAARLKHCKLEIHEEGSHFLHLEQPVQIADSILSFVRNSKGKMAG